MILVDTSVWVAAQRGTVAVRNALRSLLEDARVLAHPFVAGELTLGAVAGRSTLLEEYAQLPHAPVVPHGEVIALVEARRLAGQGLGWVDVHLLAAAIVSRTHVWTLDRAVGAAASRLRIAYQPQ